MKPPTRPALQEKSLRETQNVSRFYKPFASCAMLVLLLATSNAARAEEDESACGAVLCLAGVMSGGGTAGCGAYLARYFSIVAWRHGHLDLEGTVRARTAFTNQCPSAKSVAGPVNDRFGNKTGL